MEGDKGEMLVVDGHFYQTDEKGNISELPTSAKTPIAAITKFNSRKTPQAIHANNLKQLASRLLEKEKNSEVFYAIKIKGYFK